MPWSCWTTTIPKATCGCSSCRWCRCAATDCIAAKSTASVAQGAKELDLGATDLAPTVLSQLYGKDLPEWSVSDARGVDRSVKLSDYRGRWVLLEFWGYW